MGGNHMKRIARVLGLLGNRMSAWNRKHRRVARIAMAATALILLATFVLPRIAFGETKNSKPAGAQSSGGPAGPTSLVPIVGHPVGFASTRPLRELAAESGGFDVELAREKEEINELNSGPFGTPNPHAPVQKDGELQFSW